MHTKRPGPTGGERLARELLSWAMAAVLWVALAVAYAWSVRKLARMGWSPDPSPSPGEQVSSSMGHQVDGIRGEEEQASAPLTPGRQKRGPVVALGRYAR